MTRVSRERGLDPANWPELRALGHTMLDDVFDDLQHIADGPVWQPMPPEIRAAWTEPLPWAGQAQNEVYEKYRALIAPFGVGNRHPRFLGWVHGGGTADGVLAEMLAAGLNANCGGRDHAPIACEKQVIRWASQMLGFPPDSSGLVVTGTSMANLIAVLVAREAARPGTRRTGIEPGLTAYASVATHMCVGRALDFAGLGSDALRLVQCDSEGRIDIAALGACIAADRGAGHEPFLVVGTAGSVDTGAIDDLVALADLCASEGLWLHVDAAFGALAMLSPALRPRLLGIERADSAAFDFHKWAQVPYDSGCVLVRDAATHRAAFARPATYLARAQRGLAAGEVWPVDLGPELSRGFRALKIWMSLLVHGADRLGAVVERCCALAQRLARAIEATPRLELAAPVALNIVCFRFHDGTDGLEETIAADLQEAGSFALSTTTLALRTVLRAAFVNHRTSEADVDAIIPAVLRAARGRLAGHDARSAG